MFEVTSHTIACFIERNRLVKGINKFLIGEWLRKNSNTDKRDYKSYITIEIVSASQDENRVWEAVLRSGHIWCQSYFIGESAQLFCDMLQLAKVNGIRDKIFFDLAERREAVCNLSSEAKNLIRWLEEYNNIKFLFWEEILQMTEGKEIPAIS